MRRKLKLAALLLALGCRSTSTSTVDFEKSLLIPANVGGTLSVGETDDPQLAGASITVPPGALSADTTIVIASSETPVALTGTQRVGPTTAFGPAGTIFKLPVSLSVPFALPTGVTQSQLFVAQVDGSGNREVFQSSALAIDSIGGVIGFEGLSLGDFGAVAGPTCAQTCAAGVGVCLDGICSGELSSNVNLGCGVDGNCLLGELCDAGVCEGGFDGGGEADAGGPLTCVNDNDCPLLPTPESCVGGICVPQ